MPRRRFDFMLQAMCARDPAASHSKRDLQPVGSNLQSMLVLHLFGGNARKMIEDHNVNLAFDFARKQDKPAFSPELAEWVDKLAYNGRTAQGTKFANALDFAKELIPVADHKITELSESAAELPGRRFSYLDGHGSASFRAPLEKDVRAFVEYYDAEEGIANYVVLKKRHSRGEFDPTFEEYRAAHIDELRRIERPLFPRPRFEESDSEKSNAEKNADDPKTTKSSVTHHQEEQDNSHEATSRKVIERAPVQEVRPKTPEDPVCDEERLYRFGSRSSLTGKKELPIIHPLYRTFIIKIEDKDEGRKIEAQL